MEVTMKKWFGCFVFVALLASPAFADEDSGIEAAEKVCSRLYGADTINRCLKIVNESDYFTEGAVDVCGRQYGADTIMSCLRAIRNKKLTPSAVETCSRLYGAETIMKCFQNSGRAFQKPSGNLDKEYILSNLRRLRELLRDDEVDRAKRVVDGLIEGLR
jgi:hypothetical protein